MREVLISKGYGAGWSTWADNKYKQFLLFDKGLIELAKRKAPEEEVKEYIKSKLGEEADIYMGGWNQIEIIEVEDDDKFRVTEYSGAEGLEFRDNEEEWL